MKVEIYDKVKKRNVEVDAKLATALIKHKRAKYSEPKKKRGRPAATYTTKELTAYETRALVAEENLTTKNLPEPIKLKTDEK